MKVETSGMTQRPHFKRKSVLLFLALIAFGWPAHSVEIEGVNFPDQIRVSEAPLQVLNVYGVALLRYRILFRGYVAALYLPPDASAADALSDRPRRLELSYFWPIAGSDFGSAAEKLLERQLTQRQLDLLKPRIDQLHSSYRDVEPGDRYALTYLPGIGTELRLNNESLITIPGQDFAEAYFGIWLGQRPFDEGLRDDLLRRG